MDDKGAESILYSLPAAKSKDLSIPELFVRFEKSHGEFSSATLGVESFGDLVSTPFSSAQDILTLRPCRLNVT
jgi:hypothetical protein